MTEYSYEVKDGKIDESSKKKVYEGDYEYNPMQHFPRKNKENEGQGNPQDRKTQHNANTEDQKNSKLNTIMKQFVGSSHTQKDTPEVNQQQASNTGATTGAENGTQNKEQGERKGLENSGEPTGKPKTKSGNSINNADTSKNNGVAGTTEDNQETKTAKEIPGRE